MVTLNGEATLTVGLGGVYIDTVATATDDVDGPLPVSISGYVDTNTAGTYVLTYSATDAAGNTGTASRTITVKALPFVTTWKTNNPGVTASNQIRIGTAGGGYDYTVSWGDGRTNTHVSGTIIHTYATAGTYTVEITGDFPRIVFGPDSDSWKILSVEQWGDIRWKSMNSAFDSCMYLVINATDAPDLSQVTDMSYMFDGAGNFNQPIGHWNVSSVINMSHTLAGTIRFNQDISNWNVSAVRNMRYMFFGAWAFNQDINSWDVSAVTNMLSMFSFATAFNQDLGNWNITAVTNMINMFYKVTLSTPNYDAMLLGWSGQMVQNGINFHGGNSQYTSPSPARDTLINSYGLTITDGSPAH